MSDNLLFFRDQAGTSHAAKAGDAATLCGVAFGGKSHLTPCERMLIVGCTGCRKQVAAIVVELSRLAKWQNAAARAQRDAAKAAMTGSEGTHG